MRRAAGKPQATHRRKPRRRNAETEDRPSLNNHARRDLLPTLMVGQGVLGNLVNSHELHERTPRSWFRAVKSQR